jgi:hypothetical protein
MVTTIFTLVLITTTTLPCQSFHQPQKSSQAATSGYWAESMRVENYLLIPSTSNVLEIMIKLTYRNLRSHTHYTSGYSAVELRDNRRGFPKILFLLEM